MTLSIVLKRFFKKREMHILSWPAQISGPNPIEHIWNYLNRQISCLEQRSKEIFEDIF